MNIFKWLKNTAGKMSIAALSGLTIAGGVAAIGAWQYLSSPADDANKFDIANQYTPSEVVYVSGANTGSYQSGSYGGDFDVNTGGSSSIQVSAGNLHRLERQAMAQKAAEEMANNPTANDIGPGYQMSASDVSLGNAHNEGKELALKDNPLGAMQGVMSGLNDMVSQAQQQASAQGPAASGAAGQDKSAPALASAKTNWSGAGNGGNSFNSSFSIQDSGKNGKTKGKGGSSQTSAQDAMAAAQAQMNSAIEATRLHGRSQFGPSENLGADRDASVGRARLGSKAGNDMQFALDQSRKVAANKHRGPNDEGGAFLSSTQLSGGMMIAGENVTTGQGASSKDFGNEYEANLRGIKNWGDMQSARERDRDKARHTLQTMFWIAVGVSVAACVLIFLWNKLPLWGHSMALILAAIAIAINVSVVIQAKNYAQDFGGSAMNTWMGIGAGILCAGVIASFFSLGGLKTIWAEIKGVFGTTAAAAPGA